MTAQQIASSLAETKVFLELLRSKKKQEDFKKSMGITHKQLNQMMDQGIATLAVNVRDRCLMNSFIEDRNLVDDMVEYHNNVIKEMKENGNKQA